MSLKRTTPLPRSAFKRATFDPDAPKAIRTHRPKDVGVKRVGGLPKKNPKRKARLWESQFQSSEFVEWTQRQPCAACGERGPNQAAHVGKSRGAGGTWVDVASLCLDCHAQEHTGAKTFWKRVGKDPNTVALEHTQRWLYHTERMGA